MALTLDTPRCLHSASTPVPPFPRNHTAFSALRILQALLSPQLSPLLHLLIGQWVMDIEEAAANLSAAVFVREAPLLS
jgi:hypothetical protein